MSVSRRARRVQSMAVAMLTASGRQGRAQPVRHARHADRAPGPVPGARPVAPDVRPVAPGARLLALLVLVSLLVGCGLAAPLPPLSPGVYAPVSAKGYPANGLLVDVDWLAGRQGDPDLRLIDLSSAARFRAGHLPGAQHLWWQETIEVNNPVYGMLVNPERRAELLGGLGIDQTTTVVAYDDQGGRWAARLVWLLEFSGHRRVHLLDGGLQAWLASGRELTTVTPAPRPTTFRVNQRPELLIEAEEISLLSQTGLVIIDERTTTELSETWLGQLRRGRLPGALARPWDENLTGPAGAFRPAVELRQRYAGAFNQSRPVVVYGLFGAGAAQSYVVLRALGLATVRFYDGSWADWSANPALPIVPLDGPG